MLNIDFLKEDKNLLEVKVWVDKKSKASDETYIYSPEQVEEFVRKEVLKKYKDVISFELLTKVQKLKNKMPSHRHSQALEIHLKKEKKKVPQKPKAKTLKS